VIGRKVGDRIEQGEAVAVVHTSDPARADEGIRRVRAAYRIGTGVPARPPLVSAVVT